MLYEDIAISQPKTGRQLEDVTFTATTRTTGGTTIRARVVIRGADLHFLMLDATRNLDGSARRGPIRVKVQS